MDRVQDYLPVLAELGEQEFLRRYNHPFLLYPADAGNSAFKSYHTQMAARGLGIGLASTGPEILAFMVLTPRDSGQATSPAKLLVGRGEDRDLVFEHSTVSKRHAFLAYDADRDAYKLGDAGSTNGTFLNGNAVEAGEPVYIKDANIVSFGDCDFLFFSPKGFLEVLKKHSG